MSRLLFITWDGPQTNYLRGLFLPILACLAQSGHKPHVIQFTWGSEEKVRETKRLCELHGIPYQVIRVWRWGGGLGQFLTAVTSGWVIRRNIRAWKIDILMPRSLMPALAVLCLGPRPGLRIIFDADGFAADERADFLDLSRRSVTYRTLKWIERQMVRMADCVLVRTRTAAKILHEDCEVPIGKFFVVTNGRDPRDYEVLPRPRPQGALRLCYAGSIGAQYMPKEMLEVAKALHARLPDTTFGLFTGDILNAEKALEKADLAGADWISVRHVQPEEIPAELKACDLAFALRMKSYSTQGVAPIKIGEYLMAGLPIIGTPGIGETDPLIEAGVLFPFDGDVDSVVDWVCHEFIPNKTELSEKSRKIGAELFGIDRSRRSYEEAIRYVVMGKPC